MEETHCQTLKIQCGHVWGGIKNSDQDIETSGLRASLFSHSFDGGKGGDIYYFSVCQGNNLTRIAIADVVGHGEAISRVSECVYQSMLKYMNNPESNTLLGEWNKSIESHGIHALTTAVIGGVVVKNHRLHYSYAGHHPVLIKRNNSHRWERIRLEHDKESNLPLGVDKDAAYDQGERPICEGDKLFLYTDGLIEAPDSSGDLFGMDRLMDVLETSSKKTCTEIKKAVMESVRYFTNGRLDHDDLTLMAIDF